MSRNAFGLWGADLDRDEFACALAAVGLLEPELTLALEERLAQRLSEDSPSWSLWHLPGPEVDAARLAAAWGSSALAVSSSRSEGPSRRGPTRAARARVAVTELATRARGLHGIFVEAPPRQPAAHWSWPLGDRGRPETRHG